MNRNKGSWRKPGILVLCLLVMLFAGSLAGAETEQPVPPTWETEAVPAPLITDEQAAAGFITQAMTGRELTPPRPRGTISGNQLVGTEALLYTALKSRILQVAEGKLSSTEFRIPAWEIFDDKAYASAYDLIPDFSLVTRALLYDLPYDLYWFDKTLSYQWIGVYYYKRDNRIYISNYANASMTIRYFVSANYSVSRKQGTTVYDTSFGTRVHRAAENAWEVVWDNAAKSDLHKLEAYRDYICGAVDYDFAAAQYYPPYGDPWQLINVFDGDASTKVVCEGYAKAFQFLCDESTFQNGTFVISVTGLLTHSAGGGGHMWNIVRMPDGLYYLADITNSDSDSVGSHGELFLKGYTSRDPSQNRYNYMASGMQVSYTYDNGTLLMLNETGMLAVAGSDYVPTAADEDNYYPMLILPWYLQTVEEEAFAGTDAQAIVISDSCSYVESRAFADSDSLEAVVVLGVNTQLAANAFEGCDLPITLWVPGGSPLAALFQNDPMVTVEYLDP